MEPCWKARKRVDGRLAFELQDLSIQDEKHERLNLVHSCEAKMNVNSAARDVLPMCETNKTKKHKIHTLMYRMLIQDGRQVTLLLLMFCACIRSAMFSVNPDLQRPCKQSEIWLGDRKLSANASARGREQNIFCCAYVVLVHASFYLSTRVHLHNTCIHTSAWRHQYT